MTGTADATLALLAERSDLTYVERRMRERGELGPIVERVLRSERRRLAGSWSWILFRAAVTAFAAWAASEGVAVLLPYAVWFSLELARDARKLPARHAQVRRVRALLAAP